MKTDEQQPAGASRAGVWLRALLFSPLIISVLALSAGESGYTAIPFDTLSGGQSRWMLGTFVLLGYLSMALFGFSALMLYAMLIIAGGGIIAGKQRLATIILAALLISSYVLFSYLKQETRNEIAGAAISTESIEKNQWQAQSCGRGRYICINWQGSLGKGQVKGYISGSQPTGDELTLWTEAHSADSALIVEWGITPRGWIAARSAKTGNIKLGNAWP